MVRVSDAVLSRRCPFDAIARAFRTCSETCSVLVPADRGIKVHTVGGILLSSLQDRRCVLCSGAPSLLREARQPVTEHHQVVSKNDAQQAVRQSVSQSGRVAKDASLEAPRMFARGGWSPRQRIVPVPRMSAGSDSGRGSAATKTLGERFTRQCFFDTDAPITRASPAASQPRKFTSLSRLRGDEDEDDQPEGRRGREGGSAIAETFPGNPAGGSTMNVVVHSLWRICWEACARCA